MRAALADVVAVHLGGEVPQVLEGQRHPRQRARPRAPFATLRPVPVPAAVGHEPAGPAREVRGERDRHDEQERDRSLAQQRPGAPEQEPGAAAGQRIRHQRIHRERGEEVEAAPLHGGGSTERDAGRDQPRPVPQRRPPVDVLARVLRARRSRRRAAPWTTRRSSRIAPAPSRANSARMPSSSATRLITIALPSIASRNPRRGREQLGSGEPLRDEHGQHHEQDADDRDRDPPSDRVVGPEQRHPDADDPLAERRMHHVRRVRGEDVGDAAVELLVGTRPATGTRSRGSRASRRP